MGQNINIDAALLDTLTAIASQAAAAILSIPREHLDERRKLDYSPVTAADEAAEAVILRGLSQHLPGVPVISEEQETHPPLGHVPPAFILVDPLDGTRDFTAGRDEYTVNIAVIVDRRPVAGVVFAPALGLGWRGIAGHGAQRLALTPGAPATDASISAIATRQFGDEPVATVSRLHLDDATRGFLTLIPRATCVSSGSSVKFCRIAEGAADIYPRLSPTREWDVAAGHAVLVAAGGVVTDPHGRPMLYGRAEDHFGVPGFIARGDPGWPLPVADAPMPQA